jgi:hypothetical protein
MRRGSGYCLVVPHEELGVLLEDVVRDRAGNVDNGGIIALAPGFLEAGAKESVSVSIRLLWARRR